MLYSRYLNNFKIAIGKEKSFGLRLNCTLFCVITLFSFLCIGSFVKPVIYPLIDRVVYTTQFDNIYFLNGFFDHIIVIMASSMWLIINSVNRMMKTISIFYVVLAAFFFLSSNSYGIEFLAVFSLPLL